MDIQAKINLPKGKKKQKNKSFAWNKFRTPKYTAIYTWRSSMRCASLNVFWMKSFTWFVFSRIFCIDDECFNPLDGTAKFTFSPSYDGFVTPERNKIQFVTHKNKLVLKEEVLHQNHREIFRNLRTFIFSLFRRRYLKKRKLTSNTTEVQRQIPRKFNVKYHGSLISVKLSFRKK